jgi:hypothetical protein
MTMDCNRFVPAAGARQQEKPGSATVRDGAKVLLGFFAANGASAALSCKKIDKRLK